MGVLHSKTLDLGGAKHHPNLASCVQTGAPSLLTSTRESEVHDFGPTTAMTTTLHPASEGQSSDSVSSTTTTGTLVTGKISLDL